MQSSKSKSRVLFITLVAAMLVINLIQYLGEMISKSVPADYIKVCMSGLFLLTVIVGTVLMHYFNITDQDTHETSAKVLGVDPVNVKETEWYTFYNLLQGLCYSLCLYASALSKFLGDISSYILFCSLAVSVGLSFKKHAYFNSVAKSVDQKAKG